MYLRYSADVQLRPNREENVIGPAVRLSMHRLELDQSPAFPSDLLKGPISICDITHTRKPMCPLAEHRVLRNQASVIITGSQPRKAA